MYALISTWGKTGCRGPAGHPSTAWVHSLEGRLWPSLGLRLSCRVMLHLCLVLEVHVNLESARLCKGECAACGSSAQMLSESPERQPGEASSPCTPVPALGLLPLSHPFHAYCTERKPDVAHRCTIRIHLTKLSNIPK